MAEEIKQEAPKATQGESMKHTVVRHVTEVVSESNFYSSRYKGDHCPSKEIKAFAGRPGYTVWDYLNWCEGGEDNICQPLVHTVDSIAKNARMDAEQVKGALAKLVKDGYVVQIDDKRYRPA